MLFTTTDLRPILLHQPQKAIFSPVTITDTEYYFVMGKLNLAFELLLKYFGQIKTEAVCAML